MSVNANYAPEDCKWCNATGIDRDQSSASGGKKVSCSICYGQGSVLVAQPSRACVSCRGTGTDPDASPGESEQCLSCCGSGWAHTNASK